VKLALIVASLLLAAPACAQEAEASDGASSETRADAPSEGAAEQAEAEPTLLSVRELRRQREAEAQEEAEPGFWETWVPWVALVAVLTGVGIAIAVDLTTDAPAPDTADMSPPGTTSMGLRF